MSYSTILDQESVLSTGGKHGRHCPSVSTIALWAALSGSSILLPAHAQEADEGDAAIFSIEEIIVTARRRSENLQETPISITALTAQELESRNLTNLGEVANFVPNVTMSPAPGGSGGANNLSIYMRGVGQSEFLFTVDPGVGVYADGVYYPRSLGSTFDLLDIERVEVLRGPQGTLFGKNTIGGAVSVISAKPEGESKGQVGVTLGSYDRIDLRGNFEMPLIEDKLFAKFSASSKKRDGYGKRLDYFTDEVTARPGDEDQSAARLALRWLASPSVTVDLAMDYSHWDQQSVPEALLHFDQDASVVAQLWNIFVADPLPVSQDLILDDPYTTYATGPNENTLDTWGVSGTVNWEMDHTLSLKSITAYREMDATFGRDGDGGPQDYIATNNTQRQHQFSQELQLSGSGVDSRLDWVVGAFYFDEFGRDTNDVVLASGLFNAFEALPGPIDGSPLSAPTAPGGPGNPINVALDLDFDIFNEIQIKSYAAFAQASYDLPDGLGLTAGARYSYEEKDYTLEHIKVASGAPIIPLMTVGEDWNAFTPMVSLDYQLDEGVLAYASYSRGFKSGGFNGRPTVDNTPPEPFDPEEVTAYEIGLKSDLFDNKLRLNLAAYFNDYTDIQLSRVNANSSGVLVLDLGNAGDAEVKGFEVEVQAQPVRNLFLSAGVGYTDFEYTSLAARVTDVSLDTRQPQVPEWTANASAVYTIPVGNGGAVVVRGDWSFKSKIYYEPTNLEVLSQGAHSLINARLSYDNYGGAWEAALFVTNLTDEDYLAGGLSAVSSFGTAEGFYGRPREWGVSLKKRF